MIYIRIKLLCCILLMPFFHPVHSQPGLNLRQKLERLLQDPEYDEGNNEIHVQGMILKDLHEPGLFRASSEEKYFGRLKNWNKVPERSVISKEKKFSPLYTTARTNTLAATMATPTKYRSSTTTTHQQPIIEGIESLSSIIVRLIDLWRKQ